MAGTLRPRVEKNIWAFLVEYNQSHIPDGKIRHFPQILLFTVYPVE